MTRLHFLLQCCPGYVDTDMSSHKGPKTIDEGMHTPTLNSVTMVMSEAGLAFCLTDFFINQRLM